MPMPNQYRDPKWDKAYRNFLQMGGGPSYGLPGAQNLAPPQVQALPPDQNPFSRPTATPEEQQRVAGAVMRSKIPQQVEAMGDYQGGLDNLDEPLIEDPYETIQTPDGDKVDLATGLGTAADPNGPTAEVQEPTIHRAGKALDADRPSDNKYQQLLMDQMAQFDPSGGERGQYVQDRLQNQRNQDRNLGLMQLFARSGAQMGSTFGQVPSADPAVEAIKGQMASNKSLTDSYSTFGKKDDQRSKILLALAKMQQDENLRREGFDVQREGFENASADRNAILKATIGRNTNDQAIRREELELRRNPPVPAMTPLQQAQVELTKAKTEQVKKGPAPGTAAAKLPIETETELRATAQKITHKKDIRDTLSAALQQLRSAKNDSEFYDIGQGILKTMNSLQGQDAVGVDEARRLSAALENVSLARGLRGENPFGVQRNEFITSVNNRIKLLDGSIKSSQGNIDALRGRTPAQEALKPGFKWQRNKRTGETRQVPI